MRSASTAQAHELLGMAEAIEAWLRSEGRDRYDPERAAHDYEQAILFDEHTWGAYSSIEAPDLALHPRAVEPQGELSPIPP